MADEKQNKLTIYQGLNKILNLDGFGYQEGMPTASVPLPSASNPQQKQDKIIIKGNTPEEIQRKGLELEQKRELQNKFFRTTDRGFQKALQYEAARLPAYMDYEGMEYYPIISSALDLFMEEATTIGINGKMLNIYSNKERIKFLLEEFFYDIVNVNVNLPFWVRNTVKYGDNFVLLYGERKKGITHVKQLVNYEIERFERIQNGKPFVRFKERMTGDEFNVFEIAHFRLLGDDKYLPYGSSVLNKVRKVFRQLCLDSNSKIWTPEGYKLIKDISIGDIIYSYDYDNKTVIRTCVKNITMTGNKERFKIKTRHRELTLTDIHPLLVTSDNGSSFNYKDILNFNLKNDKLILPTIDGVINKFNIQLDPIEYYVKLNESGLSKIKNIDFTGILNKLKSYNLKTSEKNVHCFLKGYKSSSGHRRKISYLDYIKIMNAFELTLDDIDIYFRNSIKPSILDKNLNFTISTDFIKLFGFMLGDGWVRKNSIGFALGEYEDQNEYYINLLNSLGISGWFRNDGLNSKSSQVNIASYELANIFRKLDFRTGAFNKIIPSWVFDLSLENKINFIRGMFDADGCDSNGLYSSCNHELISGLRLLSQSCNIYCGSVLTNKPNIEDKIICGIKTKSKQSYSLYLKLKNLDDINPVELEKIISIENVGDGEVWDIEVDNDLHNFIADGIVVHNCMAEDAMLTYRIIRAGEKKVFKIDVGNIDEDDIEAYIYKVATQFKKTSQVSPNDGQIDYRFNILGNDEDYFLPVRNANTQTGIETLPGASNLDQIQDIEYLRDNLFIGLGVPKPFLSFQDAAGAGKNMAQYDIRFAKKINRIQQAMVQELNKMAMIHLYLLGYTGDDLKDFTLTITNPSTQQDLLKSELMREQAQTYTELTRSESGIAAMSHTNAKRMIFNMSDREIIEDLKQQKMEKVIMQELADSPVTIKKTGLFTDIDKRYGEAAEGIPATPSAGGEAGGVPQVGGEGGMPPMGGGEGGMPPSSGGEIPPPIPGLPNQTPSDLPPIVGDSISPKNVLSEEDYNLHVEKLVLGGDKSENKKVIRHKKIINENNETNDRLNTNALDMIAEIDNLLKVNESINKQQKIPEIQDIEFDDLEVPGVSGPMQ
jgi:intein/homing endonuclease